jgi:hypothetical protein
MNNAASDMMEHCLPDFEVIDDDEVETVTIGVTKEEVLEGALSIFYSNDEVLNIIPTGEVDYPSPEEAMFQLLKEVSTLTLKKCGLKVVATKR